MGVLIEPLIGWKHKICLNTECPQYTEDGECPMDKPKLKGVSDQDAEDDLKAIEEAEGDDKVRNGSYHSKRDGECPMDKPKLKGVSEQDAEDDLKAIEEAEGDEKGPKSEEETKSSDESDSDIDPDYLLRVKRRRARTDSPARRRERGEREKITLRSGGEVDELLALVEKQLDKLDERLVRVLAWQRLQEVALGERAAGRWRHASEQLDAHWALSPPARSSLAKLGVRLAPRPSDLLARADRERIARLVWGAPPAPAPAPPPQPVRLPALASLTRLVNTTSKSGDVTLGATTAMRLSSLTIGTHGECGLQLDASCTRVSGRHAVIFRDEVTNHFELINYSEWGSCVNGVMYASDISHYDDNGDNTSDALAGLIKKTKPKQRFNGALTASSSPAECQCGGAAPSAAWEGSALVPHGALLQFGCLRYVFSVTDPRR